MTMRVVAHGSKFSLNIEVGPWDEERDAHEFGMTAVVYRHDRILGGGGMEMLPAEVSMAGVGSHGTEVGRQRLAAYEAAIEIAEGLNASSLSNEEVAVLINGKDVAEAMSEIERRMS